MKLDERMIKQLLSSTAALGALLAFLSLPTNHDFSH